jgi:hypothetical protein
MLILPDKGQPPLTRPLDQGMSFIGVSMITTQRCPGHVYIVLCRTRYVINASLPEL